MKHPVSPPWRRFLTALAERVDRVERTATSASTARVTDVTPGEASDGHTLCTVIWRDAEVDAAYLSTYTPTVDDVVSVLYQGGQLLILGKPIGKP